MSRYIDADALRDKLYEADAVTMRGVAIINNEPTVDAVHVVRCKDCKYYRKIEDHSGICAVLAREEKMTDDWFCADGERRSDEDQHIYD